MVECLEALYRVVVAVIGQILDPEFKNDISTFEETFMGAMGTQSLDDTKGAYARPSCTRICAPFRSSSRTYL